MRMTWRLFAERAGNRVAAITATERGADVVIVSIV
ncbi:hypothetical protein SAJA_12870 [Salinisphaera japonica YTM-1]|uniref:Uncharacterized protein n=1 Tax=Salinisphaera japonica YTM-1 TaxID=1209778 RepID=A0A423PJC1_9GAMM|nr:hypothetical protein SAJA_12870 [Salinisphaera japonica YTM-1]